MSFDPGNRLIAAIDTPGRAEADQLIEQLGGVPGWIKLGLELFCAEGPAIVADCVARGHRVMLDLKLHDIPETVARATARIATLGAGLLTVHAGGGRAMLEAAVRSAGATRVLTAREARAAGADLVVVGRPLRNARDPAAAAQALVAELAAPACSPCTPAAAGRCWRPPCGRPATPRSWRSPC